MRVEISSVTVIVEILESCDALLRLSIRLLDLVVQILEVLIGILHDWRQWLLWRDVLALSTPIKSASNSNLSFCSLIILNRF